MQNARSVAKSNPSWRSGENSFRQGPPGGHPQGGGGGVSTCVAVSHELCHSVLHSRTCAGKSCRRIAGGVRSASFPDAIALVRDAPWRRSRSSFWRKARFPSMMCLWAAARIATCKAARASSNCAAEQMSGSRKHVNTESTEHGALAGSTSKRATEEQWSSKLAATAVGRVRVEGSPLGVVWCRYACARASALRAHARASHDSETDKAYSRVLRTIVF